jgi:hypothetical protein
VSGGAPATREALERLLISLSGAERTQSFIDAWGEPGPGWRWPDGALIAEPADPAFATIEARSWDEGAIGAVEVAFAPGSEPPLADLRLWLGPFQELVPLDDAPVELAAHWWRPGAPVEVVVLVEEPDDPDGRVPRLTLRRGPARG